MAGGRRRSKPADVTCPRCGATATLADVLARSTVSWPNQRWILATCEACGRNFHLELGDGTVVVGELDGGPGPCLMPTQTLAVPGLRVTAAEEGLTVTFAGRKRLVPARR